MHGGEAWWPSTSFVAFPGKRTGWPCSRTVPCQWTSFRGGAGKSFAPSCELAAGRRRTEPAGEEPWRYEGDLLAARRTGSLLHERHRHRTVGLLGSHQEGAATGSSPGMALSADRRASWTSPRLQRVGRSRLGRAATATRSGWPTNANRGQLHRRNRPSAWAHDRHRQRPPFPKTGTARIQSIQRAGLN